MQKLPVFGIIGQAYAFVWQQRNQFWALAVPAIIIVAIFTAILVSAISLFGDPADLEISSLFGAEATFSELIWAVAAWLAYLLVYIAVFVMYSVAWHRIFLAPENVTMIRDAYGWHRRQTRFLFAYAKVLGLLFLILFVPIVFAVILGGMASIVFNLLTVPTVIGMFWLYARLSILFPAIAVDNNLTIKGAYSFTEKNGWRLFWIVALIAIPVSIVSQPIYFGLAIALDQFSGLGPLTANLILSLVNAFFGFIAIVVFVSALSISYSRLYAHTDVAIVEGFD